MNRFIYSLLFYLATPLIILRLLLRSLRSPAYLKRWSERFALYSTSSGFKKADIIFHAVSVGEVHAAVPLINRLLDNNPELSVVVTTSTPTGSARVMALLKDKVTHVYLPYDLPGAIKRFLNTFNPGLVVIMETELWPNLIHGCSKREIRLILANARLSEKSLQNYQRIKSLATTMLGQLDRVTAQSSKDSERLQLLGLAEEKITVAGSMKYDMAINTSQVAQALGDKISLQNRPVLIAASTRMLDGEMEESKVLQAFRILLGSHPDLLLILVPRHPERFDGVLELATRQGFSCARRSRESIAEASHQILLGDTMGEMQYYFSLADVAFVGGSLVPTGCQNIIEPAALGLPVITGPSLFNFQAASEQLLQAGGMMCVADEQELAKVVDALLVDEEKAAAMTAAALAVVEKNQGASDRNLNVISELLLLRALQKATRQ